MFQTEVVHNKMVFTAVTDGSGKLFAWGFGAVSLNPHKRTWDWTHKNFRKMLKTLPLTRM